MADDAAVLDAPIESGADAVDTTVDTGSEPSTETQETTDKPASDEETQPGKFSLVQDGQNGRRVFSPQVRQHLDKLKAGAPEDQRMASHLAKALMQNDRYQRDLPGGIQAWTDLNQKLEQFGGLESVEQQRQEIEYWNGIDQMFTQADPKIVDAMTDTPEGAEAFSRLAPNLIGKWAQLQPESHGAYVAQAVLDHMSRSGVMLALDRLQDFLPADNPKATEVYNRLAGYIDGLGKLAQKPLAPAARTANADTDTRAQELEQREKSLTRTEWKTSTDGKLRDLFGSEWGKQIGNRTVDQDKQQAIRSLFQSRLEELLPKDFGDKLERFFASGQKDGFLRHHEAAMSKAVPEALRWAIRAVGIGGKPGPAAGKPAQTKPGNARVQTQEKPQEGFTRVAAKPNITADVDRNRTTPQMWAKGQAVLRDGKKVTWRV